MSSSTNNFDNVKGAGIGGRLGAMILDMLIINLFYGAVVLIISIVTGFDDMIAAFLNTEFASVYMPFKLVMVAFPIIWCTYSVILEGGKKESTWGKRAVKLRVVHIGGNRARGLDVVVRNVVKVFPVLLSSLFFDSPVLVGLANTLLFVNFIVPICNKNHRAIHDFVSGTVVAKKDEVENFRNKSVIPEINIKLPSVEELKAIRGGESKEVIPEMSEKTVAPMPKAKKLVCVSGMYVGNEILLDGNITMGRDGNQADLIFADDVKGVSRLHCRIEVLGGNVSIVDLGSTYGTFVNGTAIRAEERKALSIGDRIKLGKNEEFVLQ